MPVRQPPNRLLQLAGLATVGLLFFGGIFTPLQPCREAVFRAWLLGTQRPLSGVVWLIAVALVPTVASQWSTSPPGPAHSVGWLVLGWLISVLPFLLYRATSQRRPDLLSTLALPMWGVPFQVLAQQVLPARILPVYSFADPLATTFFLYWFAALLLWIWDLEFRLGRMAGSTGIMSAVVALAIGYALAAAPPGSREIAYVCAVAAMLLSAWNLLQANRSRPDWAALTETVALLRSPETGEPLHLDGRGDQAALVSATGERFPIVDGIPAFVAAEKLSGSNRKYHRLYRIVAGFYDDIQRVTCLLRGTTRYRYAMTYLSVLEARPGHSVLETSVGTGLNFKCFPRGVKLLGLDLSAEMLLKCQQNMTRWGLSADLFRGNAEELPFADDSVDVVFHTGGINFFNDRARAIREMIRVARPGSLLLIADETEEHVTSSYAKAPFIGRYFRNRPEAVVAPVDLVPAQMSEIHLELLRGGRFYVLTFRKPAAVASGRI